MYYRHPDELIFEELKYLYQPIEGAAIVLDLELYMKGIRQIYVFHAGSAEHDWFINAHMCLNERPFMQYVSSKKEFVSMYTPNFSLTFDLIKNQLDHYIDNNIRPFFLN